MSKNNREAFWESLDAIAQPTMTWLWERFLFPIMELTAIATVIGAIVMVVMFALALFGYVGIDHNQNIQWLGGTR